MIDVNPTPSLPSLPTSALARLQALSQDGQRKIIGLVGPPGCGKSTVAQALCQAFPALSQVMPMDGFHLANVELARLGLAQRKGSPPSFDSAGYVALLERLRRQGAEDIVYAPDFRREIEEPMAGAIAVLHTTRLLVTEGNYLLLNEGHWARVAPLLDDIWYVAVDEALRIERLTRRHRQFGRSEAEARAWVASNDEPNARLVEASQHRANFVFRWATEDDATQADVTR
jgi:pantothenate kinase